jgi:peptidoglycan hydrolase-like protein with peptidoglycan-binding domain
MTFTLKNLSRFVASAAILFGASTSIAANRPAPSARSVGSAQLEMQVLLDRADFSPGEIDDESGENSREALAAFQATRGLAPGARSRKALLKALGADAVKPIVSYTITAEDVAGPFNKTIPEDATEQSKLPGLYYTSVLEELAGKFHSAQALLKRLNPHARFIAGENIRVPNVLGAEQATRAQTGAVKIVVSKKASVLMVYDREGQVIFYAPVTSGSEHDPLPFGNWVITDVVRNPTYNYNPDLFWDADQANAKGEDRSGSKQSGGCCLDGDQRTALRHTRHAGSGGDRPFRVSRVRADDKLGRH